MEVQRTERQHQQLQGKEINVPPAVVVVADVVKPYCVLSRTHGRVPRVPRPRSLFAHQLVDQLVVLKNELRIERCSSVCAIHDVVCPSPMTANQSVHVQV